MSSRRSSFGDGERPSRVVCRILATMGADVETSEQLDRYIDSSSLDALFNASFDPTEQELLVSFLVEEHQVLLFGDRRVLIRDLGAAAGRD